MWDTVTYADLQQARQQLQLSRDEIAKRHAEELQGLDAERDEVEALERLAADFARKFKGAPEPAVEPAAPEPAVEAAAPEPAVEPAVEAAAPEPAVELAAAVPPAAPARPNAGDRPAAARQADERKYPQTNFDTFRRALLNRI